MSHGSAPPRRRERFLALALRAAVLLPLPVAEHALGALTLGHGLAARQVRGRALGWARSHAPRGLARHRLAWRLLYNRGRFLALRSVTALSDPDGIRPRVVTIGAQHLDGGSPNVGVIILVFHLGAPVSNLGLRLSGWRLVSAGDDDGLAWPPPRRSWRPLIEGLHEFVALSAEGGGGRSLYRLRRLLRAGERVILAGDARSGAAAFSVPLPAGELVVRRAWWALRRQTGARVVPAFGHVEGRRLVGTFHPPLPAPDPDPERDLEACRAVLAPIIAGFVARHPEQCLSLALDDPAAAPARGQAGLVVTPTFET